MTREALEEKRLALQLALDGQRTRAERNRLGQFATPPQLARSIVAATLGALPGTARVRFLDPAFGTGSFFSALLRLVPRARLRSTAGYEVDPAFGQAAAKLWGRAGLEMHIADFLTAEPPPDNEARPNLLVCNPPYVRHHHLDRESKGRLQLAVKHRLGIDASGLSGLYCYFMLLAHAWMADDAIAAWLIPGEFMNVGYGRAVKQYLLNHVDTTRIHRFDPAEVQFEDALVSSCVVWFRNRRPSAGHAVLFSFGGTIEKPVTERLVSEDVLRQEGKWSRFPVRAPRETARGPVIGDFFAVRRGIATGANGVFIMTREQAHRRDLPDDCLRPILPSPRHLTTDEVRADASGMPQTTPQLVLLDCQLPESRVRDECPSLWRYLEEIRPQVAGRYLCSRRSPWYSQERRPAPPFLCTYIVRATGRPFRFILNHSRATAANVYLLLYPKPATARLLAAKAGSTRRVWQALNRCAQQSLLDEGRVYGGDMHKLEPRELAAVPAGPLLEVLPDRPVAERRTQPLFEEVLVRDARPKTSGVKRTRARHAKN